MAGLTAAATIETHGIQHYDTAMRRARLALPAAEWRALLATDTRHHRSAQGPRRGYQDRPALAAWMHALDASPWVLPLFDFQAHVTSAYTCTRADLQTSPAVGAEALASDPRARVVQIKSVGDAQAWLQRLGPFVLQGEAWPRDYVVKRDTEVIVPQAGAGGEYDDAPHCVAVVGIRPDAVRVINNRGAVWGALGRAWMPLAMLEAMLDSGESYGVVPVDLVAKADRT